MMEALDEGSFPLVHDINKSTKLVNKEIELPYIQKITRAGRTITYERVFAPNHGKRGLRREKLQNPTTMAMRKLNRRRSERGLTHLVNHNFGKGDLSLALTYRDDNRPKTREEAIRRARNFIRRMATRYKRANVEFKWIIVTEEQNGKWHHHIIMSKFDTSVIDEQWEKEGYCFPRHLDSSGNYPQLASYLIKQQASEDKAGRQRIRRWSGSQNLVKPETEVTVLKRLQKNDPHKMVPKGYYIDRDTYFDGVHELTGCKYQYFTFVQLPDKKRGS